MPAKAGPTGYGIESWATMEVCLKWFQGANSNTKAKKKVWISKVEKVENLAKCWRGKIWLWSQLQASISLYSYLGLGPMRHRWKSLTTYSNFHEDFRSWIGSEGNQNGGRNQQTVISRNGRRLPKCREGSRSASGRLRKAAGGQPGGHLAKNSSFVHFSAYSFILFTPTYTPLVRLYL